ncbi:MAG: AmmeMemoRadiSam system protein B [Candidatus Diapherotrites archaeon]|uniref:MEMO1 family protein HA222_01255 n=1 Tax=Candidatus Iainarchaeum sp. TaxID=3101447 RepID=A0A7J4KTD7_9ARCH|nr:AmmeMemoRadiSam system protein B [Candidatus Diapherotrites archaeon]HIH21275.1 AmmeMemoRadiSam system protein B [Candidatus Diapherotrites archaeon]HIH33253.1 AmmeMemoRadiSam system protein B [Candidatus Diapherotrites archaeon]
MIFREPAVQGLFYPNSKALLEKQLEKIFQNIPKEKNSQAVISAHAGLIYSGATAAKSISSLKESKNYVILCPNHTGFGKPVSIFPSGKWKTLLGEVKVNEKIAESIAKKIPEAELDQEAHLQEHAIEMQLLLLQKKFPDFQIIPICLAEQRLEVLKRIGKTLSEASKEFEFGVIASSDFTHFEPEESAKEKDMEAIEKILANEVEGFYKIVFEKNMSICGFAGITALLEFARLESLKARLLEYTSSAKTTHDSSNVVGYASVAFEKN